VVSGRAGAGEEETGWAVYDPFDAQSVWRRGPSRGVRRASVWVSCSTGRWRGVEVRRQAEVEKCQARTVVSCVYSYDKEASYPSMDRIFIVGSIAVL